MAVGIKYCGEPFRFQEHGGCSAHIIFLCMLRIPIASQSSPEEVLQMLNLSPILG